MQSDIFISHAGEDKQDAARPLAEHLKGIGLSVWLDESELRLGDSLQRRIDEGLAESRFGVVILSKAFFAKHWPQKELAGLASREVRGKKVILPIWHGITREEIERFSPTLADRYAVSTEVGWKRIASEILRAVGPSFRLSKFKTDSERTLPCYHLEFLEMYANLESASIGAQFSKGSEVKFSEESVLEFVSQLWDPAASIISILAGPEKLPLVYGRTLRFSTVYQGYEKSYRFEVPLLEVGFGFDEWNSIEIEIDLREGVSRTIDFGNFNLLVSPAKGPDEWDDRYLEPLHGQVQESRLGSLSNALAVHLGIIAGLSLNEAPGDAILSLPKWGYEMIGGSEAYLLKGILR
jgi:hypothetical protein